MSYAAYANAKLVDYFDRRWQVTHELASENIFLCEDLYLVIKTLWFGLFRRYIDNSQALSSFKIRLHFVIVSW